MGAVILCLVIGTAVLASIVWGWREERRDARDLAVAERESADAPAPLQRRASAAPRLAEDLCQDAEFAFEQSLATVLDLADYYCRHAAHEDGLFRLDEYAERHPMPKRPAPPPAAAGEPWQLHFDTEGGAND
jgi:hypothetical protein